MEQTSGNQHGTIKVNHFFIGPPYTRGEKPQKARCQAMRAPKLEEIEECNCTLGRERMMWINTWSSMIKKERKVHKY